MFETTNNANKMNIIETDEIIPYCDEYPIEISGCTMVAPGLFNLAFSFSDDEQEFVLNTIFSGEPSIHLEINHMTCVPNKPNNWLSVNLEGNGIIKLIINHSLDFICRAAITFMCCSSSSCKQIILEVCGIPLQPCLSKMRLGLSSPVDLINGRHYRFDICRDSGGFFPLTFFGPQKPAMLLLKAVDGLVFLENPNFRNLKSNEQRLVIGPSHHITWILIHRNVKEANMKVGFPPDHVVTISFSLNSQLGLTPDPSIAHCLNCIDNMEKIQQNQKSDDSLFYQFTKENELTEDIKIITPYRQAKYHINTSNEVIKIQNFVPTAVVFPSRKIYTILCRCYDEGSWNDLIKALFAFEARFIAFYEVLDAFTHECKKMLLGEDVLLNEEYLFETLAELYIMFSIFVKSQIHIVQQRLIFILDKLSSLIKILIDGVFSLTSNRNIYQTKNNLKNDLKIFQIFLKLIDIFSLFLFSVPPIENDDTASIIMDNIQEIWTHRTYIEQFCVQNS
eukprot:TRINITY_DN1994_c0_g1_i1.p1 TRINITY_DN1994_c0_g1~~TRINITY_DN1994_c0_g1_i1.p1  ORF type:complete len:506 (-),score=112.21 TRINITY_DN1994_c0_g1_i1:5-1522(-)